MGGMPLVRMIDAKQEPRRVKVLVALPQRLVSEALRAALLHFGLNVLEEFPANGSEAIEAAQRLKPDVALVDYRLVDPDGLDTTRQIHRVRPKCKVIMFSWFHGMKEIEAALDAGAVGFFTSEFDLDKVANGVLRAHAGEAPVYLDDLEERFAALSKRSDKASSMLQQFDSFSPREMAVLYLLSLDYSIKEVAAELHIAPTTVKTYIKTMSRKTDSLSHQQVLVKARACGLLRT